MRKARFLVTLVAVGLLAALVVVPSALAQQTVTVNIGPGRDEASGTGTATLTDLGGGRTRIVLNVARTNANMPAHIHVDTCPGVGSVVVPLTNVMNGTSTTEVNQSLSAILAAGKSINLHKAPDQAGVYTGCGNLMVAGAQAAPAQAPRTLPRTGDAASLASLLAAAGAGLAGAGLVARRRFRR